MSRRRVSVRDLGSADCQGWLLRRSDGRRLLGSRWKKFWFVLKSSCLYWYKDKTAEKAEGFINLSGFSIERAKHSRRKHAMTATHALVVTMFMAAESFTDMNRWISKLSEAAESRDAVNAEDCYSEGSDEDEDEESSSCLLEAEQEAAEPENADAPHPPPPSSSSPGAASRPRSTSEGAAPTGNQRRRAASDGGGGGERRSCPDVLGPPRTGEGASPPLVHVVEDELVPDRPADELERLYRGLKAASLSPMGTSNQRDFRSSFIRRCHDDQVNDKVHLLRILSSTLKAKEAELQALDQILTRPDLTADTYRKWRLSNAVLLQDVRRHKQEAGSAAAGLVL